jgi:hypothetical protein
MEDVVMAGYCELEVNVDALGEQEYWLSARFRQPEQDQIERTALERISFDTEALAALRMDNAGYGKHLAEMLFGKTAVGRKLSEARAIAKGQRGLRMRLAIDTAATGLHDLRWETLWDPAGETPLTTRQDLLFSRYLANPNVRPIVQPARSQLRALVAIANPVDLASWEPEGRALAPVDVEGELERAQAALAGMYVEPLAKQGEATLENIVDRLRDGFDILYLVCHGALVKGRPMLWLDDGEGQSQTVSGRDLAAAFDEMSVRPRLVVLASCQSAGTGSSRDAGALAGVGPLLAQAGVPAVLAMQGDISMESVKAFMPVFFKELAADGQVDRAVALARARIGDRPDWWAPSLFMRLESGRLWPGSGGTPVDDEGTFDRWEALVAEIRGETCNCIPVLGPGISETVIGSLREIAAHMAETYDFALAPNGRDELAQVAQYLSYRQSGKYVRNELATFLKGYLLDRKSAVVPDALKQMPLADLKVDTLISALGEKARAASASELHARLAACPFPIYVTTSRDNLLRDALLAAGKKPRSLIARWRRFEKLQQQMPGRFDVERGFTPTAQEPVVLHIFGNLDLPETLVVSQDDYFDFLVGITQRQGSTEAPGLPHFLSSQLSSSGLLFLGFSVDDWEFRILYRTIRLLEGMQARAADGEEGVSDLTRVAVQINPEEGYSLQPYGARRYLKEFFHRTTETAIFWGSVDDFVGALADRLGALK